MKKIIKENYRVIIEPHYALYLRGEELEEDARRTCESIVEDIKRHVDEVGRVDIENDSREICEFCLREWDVYEKDDLEDGIVAGLPGCCNKAQEEFYAQKEKDEKMLH